MLNFGNLMGEDMGQVVIEIPQNVYRNYIVEDTASGEQLLEDIEAFSKNKKSAIVIPPSRKDRKKALDAVFGIWSDRQESGQEIAQKLRENNRRVK